MVKFYEENRFEELEKVLDKTYNSHIISKLVEGLCALGNAQQLVNLYTKSFSKFSNDDRLKIIEEICRKGGFKELREFVESSIYIPSEHRKRVIKQMSEKGTFDELADFLNNTRAYLGLDDEKVLKEKLAELAKRIEEEPKTVTVVERKQDIKRKREYKYDIFICHASEDKKECADEIAGKLREKGLKVWYDDFVLRIGDSLWRKINEGLKNSMFGIVILSPNFFKKDWPQKELSALATLERDGRKVILPIWHEVSFKDVVKYSPALADRLAAKTEDGIDEAVTKILEAIKG